MVRATRCLSTEKSAYAAERKDIDYERLLKEQGKAPPARLPRHQPENWQPCWLMLRTLDKWSGETANPDMEKLFLDDTGDSEDPECDSDSEGAATVDSGRRKGKRMRGEYDAFQSGPYRHKAAKREIAAKAAESKLKASLTSSDQAM